MLNNTFIPKLSEHIVYTTQNGKHLFLNVEIPDWVVLNSNGAYIVGLIDGERTIQKIALELTMQGHVFDEHELISLIITQLSHIKPSSFFV